MLIFLSTSTKKNKGHEGAINLDVLKLRCSIKSILFLSLVGIKTLGGRLQLPQPMRLFFTRTTVSPCARSVPVMLFDLI